MATFNGVVHGKIIELKEEPGLPDGQTVAVTIQQIQGGGSQVSSSQAPTLPDSGAPSIEKILAALAANVPPEEWKQLPVDLTDDLDHYVYGTAKQ